MDEIRHVADQLPSGTELARLHWGGGTPTILSADLMAELGAFIQEHLPLARDSEFSVEVDPNEVGDARLDALVGAGMNRASMGIQDFDQKIQEAIGRLQSFEVTKSVADKLRARGIRSLNADILYGLPYQDRTKIAETTHKVVTLRPDRVALYGYAHVPWMARRQTMIPEQHLPNSEERLELFETSRDIFLQAGYREIGIDHFALPGDGLDTALSEGRLKRNFQGYTDDQSETLIGLGASAISRFRQGYVQNVSATASYLSKIRGGAFATARGHEFAGDDWLRARVIEELMCAFRVDLTEVEAEFDTIPVDLRFEFSRVFQKYAPFVTFEDGVLEITHTGQSLTRMIAREFDTYSMDENGHSLAI